MGNCFVCGKKKLDYEVWWNKLAVGITYDSEFQNNEIICSMSEKSMICHKCIKEIEKSIEEKKKQ
ncbi:hypothetical protein [Candidatus Nitrosarchaeum limnium]|jgi:hypothetical protein|uniref:hypothetical protein n=1 Tax=Candidatus Nitrosarchaeum limnium TaxID=1007084 RepID=UPI00064F973A|nr:hypothetical protein [Candidatus Nitrosarchaeum limnium]